MNINKLFTPELAKLSTGLVLVLIVLVLLMPQASADEMPAKTAEEIIEEQEAEEQREKLARFKAEYLIKQVENKRINSEIELLKNKITKKKLEQDLQKLTGESAFLSAPKRAPSMFAPMIQAIEKPIEQVANIITPRASQAVTAQYSQAEVADSVIVTSFILAQGTAFADFVIEEEEYFNVSERETFAGGYRFVYKNEKVMVTFAGQRVPVKGLSSEL